MKKLKAQIDFVEALFINFMLSAQQYIKNAEEMEKSKDRFPFNRNWMNKNCGKYALKRKITMIRQELLNLEKMIDERGAW
jgi:hypothetical protein